MQIYQEMSYAIVRLPHPQSRDSQGQETLTHTLTATTTQSAQTTIPPNHHNALGLSRNKIKW